jgi:hypothetical protein
VINEEDFTVKLGKETKEVFLIHLSFKQKYGKLTQRISSN